jgi:hypothetical protein
MTQASRSDRPFSAAAALHAGAARRSVFGQFRPDDEICAIRSLWRHRGNLIQLATVHLQHMQKALDQMNLRIHHVISIFREQQVWRS